jgi:hypothetical protein
MPNPGRTTPSAMTALPRDPAAPLCARRKVAHAFAERASPNRAILVFRRGVRAPRLRRLRRGGAGWRVGRRRLLDPSRGLRVAAGGIGSTRRLHARRVGGGGCAVGFRR